MPKPGYNKLGDRVIVEEHNVKPRKSRAAMSTIKTTPDRLKEQLKTVLARDIAHLLTASFDGKLNQTESQSLITYFKVVSDLNKEDKENMSSMTDEELERLANES
jgi:uncharacterized membrane protein YvbJ